MNDELQQANITISGVEYLSWGLKIKDEKGLIYNVSRFLKGTQTETVAYKTLSALPQNGVGLTKCFKFAVVPNNQGGQSRYVRIVEEPSNTSPQATGSQYRAETPKVVSNSTPANNNVDWGKIAGYNEVKTDSMREMGAKRTAGEYANIMLQIGAIQPEQWFDTFNNMAHQIYNHKITPFG